MIIDAEQAADAGAAIIKDGATEEEEDVSFGDPVDGDETDENLEPDGESDETSETDGTTESDETSETDGAIEPDETAETDGAIESDETSETDGTAEPDEATESDETSETDGTAEPDETTEPDGTAEPDEATEPDGTAEPDEATEPDGTAETDEVLEPEKILNPDETNPDRSISIIASWGEKPLEYGDTVTLSAELSGYEGLDIEVFWQCDKGEGFEDCSDTMGQSSFQFVVDETNAAWIWRAGVVITMEEPAPALTLDEAATDAGEAPAQTTETTDEPAAQTAAEA